MRSFNRVWFAAVIQFLILGLWCVPAHAQIDFSGEWSPLYHEDAPERGFRPAEQLIALAESGQRRLFLEGKVLMAQDAANQSLHILVKGRVRVDRIANGKNELIGRLGPGDLIGDMGVLNGTPRLATVTAIEDVETLELGEEVLRGVFKQHSALLLAMMRLVHDRLESKKA